MTVVGALALALSSPATLLAQEPVVSPPGVTVLGVVTEWTTGTTARAPIVAADISLVGSPRRTATDAQGRFFLRDVPLGTHVFRVSRLGYVAQDVEVAVTDPMEMVDIRLFPNPVALEGLTVTGDARGPLTGIVLDAGTGDRLPWARLELRRNVTEQVGRPVSGSSEGDFEIGDVEAGNYLLLVEKLGYHGQYLSVAHGVPAEPVVVRLEPDTALMRGIARADSISRVRLNAHPRGTFVYDEARLRNIGYRDLCDFTRYVLGASDPLIDDRSDSCAGFTIADIYRVDVYTCGREMPGMAMEGRRARSRLNHVRIYTKAYIERQARDPWLAIPVMC